MKALNTVAMYQEQPEKNIMAERRGAATGRANSSEVCYDEGVYQTLHCLRARCSARGTQKYCNSNVHTRLPLRSLTFLSPLTVAGSVVGGVIVLDS